MAHHSFVAGPIGPGRSACRRHDLPTKLRRSTTHSDPNRHLARSLQIAAAAIRGQLSDQAGIPAARLLVRNVPAAQAPALRMGPCGAQGSDCADTCCSGCDPGREPMAGPTGARPGLNRCVSRSRSIQPWRRASASLLTANGTASSSDAVGSWPASTRASTVVRRSASSSYPQRRRAALLALRSLCQESVPLDAGTSTSALNPLQRRDVRSRASSVDSCASPRAKRRRRTSGRLLRFRRLVLPWFWDHQRRGC